MNEIAREIKSMSRNIGSAMAYGIYIYADMNKYYFIASVAILSIVGSILLAFTEAYNSDKANLEKKNE